jgi:hypothetical protein
LHGGTLAQDLFFVQRIRALASIFNLHVVSQSLDMMPTISFHDHTLIEMNPMDQSWLLYPKNAPTMEYVSPHGQYILPHKPSVPRYSIESEDKTSLEKTSPKKPLPDTIAIPSSPHFLPFFSSQFGISVELLV